MLLVPVCFGAVFSFSGVFRLTNDVDRGLIPSEESRVFGLQEVVLNRFIAPIIICLVGFAYSLPGFSQEGKLPEPPPLEQEETGKLIKKLFRSEAP